MFQFSIISIQNIGRLDPTRYSNWKRLCRITAWIQRFIDSTRNPTRQNIGPLKPEEYENAELQWIKVAQTQFFWRGKITFE